MIVKQTQHNIWLFVGFLMASLLIHHIDALSILKIFFKQFEILFHESGHGFMTFAVGGTVEDFNMSLHAGFVNSMLPIDKAPLVALSGYLGAAFFGLLLFFSSNTRFVKVIKAFIIATIVFWCWFADGWLTLGLLLLMMVMIIGAWFLGKWGAYVMRFIAIYVMTSAIYSPAYLFYIDGSGDHFNLSELTGFPVWMFIVTWILFAIGCLVLAFIISLKKKPDHDIPASIAL